MTAHKGEEVERLPNGLEIQPTTLETLRRFAEAGYLYAVIDSADAPAVPEKARALGEGVAVSLFKGTAQEEYWAVAPYLFKVSPETLDWLVEALWKEPWGIFAMSKASLEELRTHFRRFLLVQLPDGKRWFFRYYDPRILKSYLPTCSESDLKAFTGPIRGIALGHAASSRLWLVHGPLSETGGQTEAASGLLWQINPTQEQRLDELALADFGKRMIIHLRKFFPDQCEALSPEQMREAIQFGIKRAATYRMVAERDVCKYIDLMFAFGRNFDTDVTQPWAAQILAKPGSHDPTVKINELYDAAMANVHRAIRVSSGV